MALFHNAYLKFEGEVLIITLQELHDTKWGLLKGEFEVNDIYNEEANIYKFLTLNQRPTLEYLSEIYEVIITDSASNFLPDNSRSFTCGFVAAPLKVKKTTTSTGGNKVIWSMGCSAKPLVADLPELIDENLEELVSLAIDKINHSDNKSFADELASIVAGRKNVAVANETELNDPLVVLLLKEISVRGLDIQTVDNFDTKNSGRRSIIAGKQYYVRQVKDIISQAVRSGETNSFYYYQLSRLLGKPNINILDFGFNRT